MFKKVVLTIVILATIIFVGCTKPNNDNPKNTDEKKLSVNIATLKGPTGMGMIKLIEENEKGNASNDYTFTIAGSPDEITGKLITGEIKIAALPINLAATLYNKTEGKIQIAALNTLGVLYILENGETIQDVSDLKDKKVLATGQGATPEYVLDYIIKKNNLNTEIEYKSEHSELAALALAGKADLLMLPEPFVTTVLSKNADFRVALDLTTEFEKVSDGTLLSMGCIVVNKEFAENNKAEFTAFLNEYKLSAEFVNSDKAKAAELIAKHEILANKELAEQAIPNCNIVFIAGEEMKTKIKGFYDFLYEYNPTSIGGKLPQDDFYYVG